MAETLVSMTPPIAEPDGRPPSAAERDAARELVRLPRDRGVALTGPDVLLKALTKTVIETALDEEMSEHLGYDKFDPASRNRGNSCNGVRAKTVLTDAAGHVEIEVPRDRDGTFEPQLVKKRQRRLSDVDDVVLSLCAKGLTTGEIGALRRHLRGVRLQRHRHPHHRPSHLRVGALCDRGCEPGEGLGVLAAGCDADHEQFLPVGAIDGECLPTQIDVADKWVAVDRAFADQGRIDVVSRP